MNIARITGIILFTLGIYLFTLLDKYDFGFFGGFIAAVITILGLNLTIFGKFKQIDKLFMTKKESKTR